MDERNERKKKFKVIKTYPSGDCIVKTEYEGTIEELCIELEKYLGSKAVWNRRLMEKELYLYEQEHKDVHFEMYNMQTRRWKILHRNEL